MRGVRRVRSEATSRRLLRSNWDTLNTLKLGPESKPSTPNPSQNKKAMQYQARLLHQLCLMSWLLGASSADSPEPVRAGPAGETDDGDGMSRRMELQHTPRVL